MRVNWECLVAQWTPEAPGMYQEAKRATASKVYDCVLWGMLWGLLWEYGVAGTVLRVIQSFLYYQNESCVCIKDCIEIWTTRHHLPPLYKSEPKISQKLAQVTWNQNLCSSDRGVETTHWMLVG